MLTLRHVVQEARKRRIRSLLQEAIKLQEMGEEDYLCLYGVVLESGPIMGMLLATRPTALPPVRIEFDRGKPGLRCHAPDSRPGYSAVEWFFEYPPGYIDAGHRPGLVECLDNFIAE